MLRFITSKLFYMPIFYIVGGIIVYLVISKIINGISKNINVKSSAGLDKRKNTIIDMINNIIKYIILIIVIIMILNLYGVDTTSIIASLGVISLVIGLAFQDIIKDFLAGMFIIFDNQYAVGDTIEVNGFKGEVIALGLKTTKIKAYTGEVKTLSNSSFNEVINYNLNPTNLLMYIPFGYDVKVERIEKILNKVGEEIKNNENVRDFQLLGIDSFCDSCMKYLVVINCKAMTQFGIKREVLRLVKCEFDKAGIAIPYNKLDIEIKKQEVIKVKKVEKFKTEINYIKDTGIRKDLRKLIGMLPDYFFEVPASSTGKYHPEFSLGDGGLVRHTKVAAKIAYELLSNNTTGIKFRDRDKDLIIMAIVLHDGLKSGVEKSKYTKFEHPLLVSKFIMENKSKLGLDVDDIRKVCSMIESHIGEWTVDPYTKKEVLPKPRTAEQRFVHMCDYLASRKFLDVKFEDGEIVN